MASSAYIRITKLIAPALIGKQLVAPVNNLAQNVAVRMRRLVPKASFRLRDTIEAVPATSKGAEVTASVRFGGKVIRGRLVDYHLYVERGTSRMKAQPYARPALYQSKSLDLTTRISS